VTEWQDVTGGSNGVLGVWPDPPFDAPWRFYLLTLAAAAVVVAALRIVLFSPFGYAIRAGRDSPLRAEAIGINVRRVHWVAFVLAGAAGGLAGGLFAFAKGSISPETINVGRSIDAIVMVLLGGLESLSGPIAGAAIFTTLQDTVMRQTEYWRALLGAIILALVLLFPGGIAGSLARAVATLRAARSAQRGGRGKTP
jgi:branched-chain amino acid transport system permease protein